MLLKETGILLKRPLERIGIPFNLTEILTETIAKRLSDFLSDLGVPGLAFGAILGASGPSCGILRGIRGLKAVTCKPFNLTEILTETIAKRLSDFLSDLGVPGLAFGAIFLALPLPAGFAFALRLGGVGSAGAS